MRPAQRSVLRATGALFLLAFGSHPLVAQDPLARPQTAVVYVEYPDGGPDVDDGRDLGNGGLRTAIDINSHVKVTVNSERLEKSLLQATPQTQTDDKTQLLVDRLKALKNAVEQTQELVNAYREEADLYEQALAQQSKDQLDAALVKKLDDATGRRATVADGILSALEQSLVARFRETFGLEQEPAEDRADSAFDPIFDQVPDGLPYNMTALSSLLNGEIEHAEADVRARLETLDGSGLAVELRGHLVRTDGSAIAIPLPGHNLVQAGIEQPFQKIDFSLSPEEEQLQTQYEALAERIRQAQAEGEDVLDALKKAFNEQQLPIVEALEAAESAVDNAGDQLENLLSWADLDRLETWARGPAKEALSESMKPAFTEFKTILDAAGRDIETLKTLGDLATSIRQSRPQDAVIELLNALSNTKLENSVTRALTPQVWADRLAEVEKLIAGSGSDALAALGEIDGPIKAWNDAVSSLEEVETALEPVKEGARQALASLRGGAVAPVTADLPEPEGQKRRSVRDNLDTEFNLLTIPGRRGPGDEIRLSYTFFDGDEPLSTAGWTDTFRLQVFGWQGQAFASIALVRFKTESDDDEQWEPTAPVSYLLHRRPWPGEDESGLAKDGGGPVFTFGFSTMALDFSDDESVELGIAATVGLLNNFVMLGYGINLQADEEDFFFLSLRPFSLGNMFSPARSQ